MSVVCCAVVSYSLFAINRSLFVVGCCSWLCVVRRLLFGCSLFAVRCSLFVVRLCVVCCLLFVVCCLLCDACCLLLDVSCSLFVVNCL